MDDVRMTHDLQTVVDLFAAAPHWWAIGGGWAIDLHLGQLNRRPHKDVDLICASHDAPLVREHLAGWDLYRVIDGDLAPWTADLPPAHQAWVRPSPDDQWAFEILFERIEDGVWHFRRNPAVTRPAETLATIIDEIPTASLGLALLYKAKRDEDLDLEDLLSCLPIMDSAERTWLARAVADTHGEDHRWVAVLGVE